ncbi:hypothetical protein [Uliginosibacterium sp. 31-12]|uniref:type IV pili methyl-accepting chemotaxis transducer N-terminal domain-containing protein n=1 Tax=Uliginosibacterium sp. 31-12 TaxID=3062781 RepID=UPI0026E13309|nr:hypothetical protein [Uliginosibacterium sp. 31-12]MDO6387063.1 hypothetical protein [Uliginosibacterium sp. 31-12]
MCINSRWWARCLILCFPFACSAVAAPSSPAVMTPMEAAGKLRSLAQRQAKLYLQARVGVEQGPAQQRLAESIAEFERCLPIVQAAAQSGSAARSARRMGSEWESFRKALEAPLNGPAASSLSAEAEQISIAAQSLAVQFDLAQESPLYRLVDLASRSDMLAQRLARIYMQMRAGMGGKAAEVDLEQTRKEFKAAFGELAAAAENTPTIRANLEVARQQWMFFELAVNDREKSFEFARRDVATTSERISQIMNESALAYMRLVRDAAPAVASNAGRR